MAKCTQLRRCHDNAPTALRKRNEGEPLTLNATTWNEGVSLTNTLANKLNASKPLMKKPASESGGNAKQANLIASCKLSLCVS